MKKYISLLLTAIIILCSLAVFPLTASAEEAVFHEGDVLYLRVESPSGWTENTTLYVNFTEYSREDNGGVSIVINDADPEMYKPVTGLHYISDRNLYSYTVTAEDAGAAAMRFWRGSSDKLWNCSVVLTAEDFSQGLNTAVVTDWTDSGYLEQTYSIVLKPKFNIIKKTGDNGDSYDITVECPVNKSTNLDVELYINDKMVSDTYSYMFIPESSGIYKVRAELTATHYMTGALLAKATVTTSIAVGTTPVLALSADSLYAHADRGSKERDAWVKWYESDGVYYFFLPSCINEGEPVELFNSFLEDVYINEKVIPSYGIAEISAKKSEKIPCKIGEKECTAVFLYSSAESALFVNNTDDFNGMDFFTYLQQDKSNSVSASAAYISSGDTVTGAEVKKMKGRGNTSWNADKKGYNITIKDTISVAGMEKSKKYSLISNFQDAAMARNRILYDLSDAVGIPYASDSRMIDLYTNGEYQGTYQMCQKIEVGKNSLMPDIDEKDYLDKETGGVKSDFSFVTEIDSSPAADDFHFTVQNGNNLTMKSPELESGDPNLSAVRGYVKSKYNAMYNKLSSRADNLNDYIDVDSLAKVYIINELGKNWDSGASSFFLTYKPDSDGNYKFFASPVWDYDNSLGNAKGTEGDLRNMGITDYTLPTGWFSTKKNGYNGPNFLATAAKHPEVMAQVYKVWFEDFVPALYTLNKTGIDSGELYSADVYRSIISGSAEMNYHIWELETNTRWIADHSALQRWGVSYTYNDYGQIIGVDASPYRSITRYDQYTFDGQFDYMMDWLNSRTAWISKEYIPYYTPEPPEEKPTEAPTEAPTAWVEPPVVLLGDADGDNDVSILDATAVQRHLAELSTKRFICEAADADLDGSVSILDATSIQRYLAELSTNPDVGNYIRYRYYNV